MTETAIEVKGLRFEWVAGEPVLDIPSFVVARGERVFLEGPSGSGKTLLFLRGTNLLNEEVRYHTSPLKDEVPLPGRSLAAGVRFSFGR